MGAGETFYTTPPMHQKTLLRTYSLLVRLTIKQFSNLTIKQYI